MKRSVMPRICVAVLAAFFMAAPGHSHTIIDATGKPFTYDLDCCSEKDCQPIADNEAVETDSGWSVDYVSKFSGRRVVGVIPKSSTALRKSPDGRAHACESVIPVDGEPNAVKPRCIYPPIPSI